MNETDRLEVAIYLVPVLLLGLLFLTVRASHSGWSLLRIRIVIAASCAAFILGTALFIGMHPLVALAVAFVLALSSYGYSRLLAQWSESEAGAAARAAAGAVPGLGGALRRFWQWEHDLEQERSAKEKARA